jgi:Rrf2 family protein
MRAAAALARSWDSRIYRKIREISEEMAIPARYTPEILGLLQRAGLAQARAGRSGGYILSRPPSEISLLEVIEASEGPLTSERCVMSGGPCHWQGRICAVHPMLEAAGNALTDSLRGQTLASIANFDRALWHEYETSHAAEQMDD